MPATALATTALTAEEEELIEFFYKEVERSGQFTSGLPACPQGGKCDCPKTKADKLGLQNHQCNPDLSVMCIVRAKVFAKGLRA